jgi:hypothetical protein
MRSRPGGALLLALCVLTLGPAAAEEPAAQRVLFIGNSLTLAHDLPGMVAALSRAAGDTPPFEVGTVAYGNFGLQDHWARKEAVRTISAGGWSYVVLQQGPSSLPKNREGLLSWTRRFTRQIRKIGARTALYMVWPSRERSGDFDAVVASYAAAAREVDGVLLPAGEAWRAAWQAHPEVELYGEDDFHPSLLGSYLAAVVVYSGLSGRDPIGLPTTLELAWGTVKVPEGLASVAQQAAREALSAAAGPAAP